MRSTLDLLACINIPSFTLQVVLAQNPGWRGDPVAAVAEDGPQARIAHVNDRALALGVMPGMRYATAVALVPRLRAGILSDQENAAVIGAATRVLRAHSPEVEPSSEEPGVFWVNVAGLDGVYGSRGRWAEAVRAGLGGLGLRSAIVVGFSRFGTYAAASSCRSIRTFENPQEEKEVALRTPLRALHLPDEPAALLSKLGVADVAALLRLPREGLLRRFGHEVHRLHQFAAGDLWVPLRPTFEREVPRVALVLDSPENRSDALLFLIKRALPNLLSRLASRGEALAALAVHLKVEGEDGSRRASVRPVAPTLDDVQLLDLIRLRLERTVLAGGVAEIELEAHGTAWAPDAPRLFPEHPGRDLASGRRALARLRASLGEDAVVRARVKQGHLPEARFVWEAVEQIVPPRPVEDTLPTLIRRIWKHPVPLAHGAQEVRTAGAGRIPERPGGAAGRLVGPYVVSGGWWMKEVHREYYFAETPRGELLWIYFDRRRQRWFAHGRVE